MRCRITIDATGWHATNDSGRWQSVSSDEMKVQISVLQEPFPEWGDVSAVRDYFRRAVAQRPGALISCDPIENAEPAMFRIVYKYPAGRGYALTFEASLAVPMGNVLLQLLISSSEDTFTGTREAFVLQELLTKAGPSESAQWAKNVVPIEWRFERYQPGTRGAWAYFVSDDERYDVVYPNHPLTRVRRWLRRMEKTYRVFPVEPPSVVQPTPQKATESGGGLFRKLREALTPEEVKTPGIQMPRAEEQVQNRIEIQVLPLKPMVFDEIAREFGSEIASDAMNAEAIKRTTLTFPTLEVRQQMYRDRRDAEMKKLFDEQARIQAIRDAGKKLATALTPGTAELILARIRASGRWLIQPEGGQLALAAFSSMAHFDDYTENKGLPSNPEVITVSELFTRFCELKALGIDSLTIDRCPRCGDDRQSYSFHDVPDEARLLQVYGVHVAGQKYLAQEKLQTALQEPDLAKRLEALRYIVDHVSPASVEARVEIAKIAVVNGDASLYGECKAHFARYSPGQLSLLP